MIPHVFLSLSGSDSAFVNKSREHVFDGLAFVYTESFATGDQLIEAMERNIKKSAVFALFASKSSLRSVYVNFEIDVARLEKIIRPDFKILVFVIDKHVTVHDLPAWMQRYWVSRNSYFPKDVARYLNSVLLSAALKPKIYGRGSDLDKIDEIFATQMREKAVAANVFLFSGLNNIGRRSIAREAIQRIFQSDAQFNFGPVISLTDAPTTTEIYRNLRDAFLDQSRPELERDLLSFAELSPEKQASEIRENLLHFASLGEVVFLKSAGGFFDDLGNYTTIIKDIIASVENYPRIKIFLISNRQGKEVDTGQFPNLFHFHVKGLKDDAIEALVTSELQKLGLRPFTLDKETLIAIGGHPGTAKQFVRVVHQKGTFLARDDIYGLATIQGNILSENIRYEYLTSIQRDILAVLSWLPSLSNRCLMMICDDSSAEDFETSYREALLDLILASLVEVIEEDLFIARPIRQIFRRMHGYGGDELTRRMASVLKAEWEESADGTLRASVIDAYVFMYLISGRAMPSELRSLILPGVLLNGVREIYRDAVDDGDSDALEQVANWAALADEMKIGEQDKEKILSIGVRALIRLGKFPDADAKLRDFQQRGYGNFHALKGFFHRQKHEFKEAIQHYRDALKLRIHDDTVVHELCLCLFRIGNIDEIKDILSRYERSVERNAYLLDLRIQIAMAEGDFGSAETDIARLRSRDDDRNRSYRREAILFMKRDQNFSRALGILNRLVEEDGESGMEFLSVRAIAFANAGNIQAAKSDVEEIRRKRDPRAAEVTKKLDAHLALAQEDWARAEAIIEDISHRSAPDELLRAKILELKSRAIELPRSVRDGAAQQAALIRRRYRSTSDLDFF